MADPMQAITIHQPWTDAIFNLGKDTENRSWFRVGLPGRQIAVHSGKDWSDDGATFIAELGLHLPEVLPMGAIVGVATVEEIHSSVACLRTGTLSHLHPDGPYTCSRWAMGGATGDGPMYHWRLSGVRAIDPLPCKGAQQLWWVPDHLTEQIRHQIASEVPA